MKTKPGSNPSTVYSASLHSSNRKSKTRITYRSNHLLRGLAFSACLGLSGGWVANAYAHNCGSFLAVLSHPGHCAEHAANETASFVNDEIVKPVGACVDQIEQCAQDVVNELGLDDEMQALILDSALEELTGVKQKLINFAEEFRKITTESAAEVESFITALKGKDFPRAMMHLSALLKTAADKSDSKKAFADLFKGLKKDLKAQSVLFNFTKATTIAASKRFSIGVAVDIDYLIYTFSDDMAPLDLYLNLGSNPVASEFDMGIIGGGVGYGHTYGLGIGFSTRKPGQNLTGPLVSVRLANSYYGGGAFDVEFNVSGFPKRPPEFSAATLTLQAGVETSALIGGGYKSVRMAVCGDASLTSHLEVPLTGYFYPVATDLWPCQLDLPSSISSVNYEYGARVWGGDGGSKFSDIEILQDSVLNGPVPKVTKIALRSGSRVDRVRIDYDNGEVAIHGGGGGTAKSLEWSGGLSLMEVEVCKAYTQKYESTTVHYVKFTLRNGNSIAGGTRTSDCVTLKSNLGYPIHGFRGRSGTELDSLGVIFQKQASADL